MCFYPKNCAACIAVMLSPKCFTELSFDKTKFLIQYFFNVTFSTMLSICIFSGSSFSVLLCVRLASTRWRLREVQVFIHYDITVRYRDLLTVVTKCYFLNVYLNKHVIQGNSYLLFLHISLPELLLSFLNNQMSFSYTKFLGFLISNVI